MLRYKLIGNLAIALAAVLVGCADSESVTSRMQDCVAPKRGYEVCYETLGHQRPIVDVMKGSPGITMRLYGRAQGRDVPFTIVHGGPECPYNWSEQAGYPDCYEKNVDYGSAIELVRAKAVASDLESHKAFIIAEMQSRKQELAEQNIPPYCDGVTIDNMVDKRHEPERHALRPDAWQRPSSDALRLSSSVGTPRDSD